MQQEFVGEVGKFIFLWSLVSSRYCVTKLLKLYGFSWSYSKN